MLGTELQLHAFAQLGHQVDLPIAQLQAPLEGHALFGFAAVDQLPVEQARPTVGRPHVFAGVTAVPGPAHRHTATDRADLWPLRRTPQPRALALWLEVQQLRALTAEDCLALRVIDDQHIALLVTLPLEGRPRPLRGEETL
ncbi:hypothetical protein D3C80_1531650 [compost metagenome]